MGVLHVAGEVGHESAVLGRVVRRPHPPVAAGAVEEHDGGATLGAEDVGAGGPAGGGSFQPGSVDESVNDALGGVLDDLLQDPDAQDSNE